MIPKFLINPSNKVLCLFDMDGVCAEFYCGENDKIENRENGVYLAKRPIKTIINIMDTLHNTKNITIGILSSCISNSQKEEKIKWLDTYCSFINKENIYIIIWDNELYKKETRAVAKLNIINKIQGYDKIYLFEDKHTIIKATNSQEKDIAHHVSELID